MLTEHPFKQGGGLSELVMVKYFADDYEEKVGRPLKVAAQKHGNLVCYFIKLYMFVNAVGDVGSTIYIIADPNMNAEEIDVQEIRGMGICTDLTCITYIVFCQSISQRRILYMVL